MSYKFLVVEDQPLLALALEEIIDGLGYVSLGTAATKAQALDLGRDADIALVDVNLIDGPTGPDIGRSLAARNISVLFMTADPEQLGDGVPGTLGVIAKPLLDLEAVEAVQYAVDCHQGKTAICPESLVEFT